MVKLSLFPQITKLIPKPMFTDIVKKYEADKHSKGIDSWTHLVSMLFCNLGHANSLRDISNGLRDEINENDLVFLTNNRYWTASTVAEIYKERWNIESFFKLIKKKFKDQILCWYQ